MVSPASVLWYAWNLLSNQLYLLPFLLFVCGVVLLFRRPDAARRNLYPVLLIASCYVSFTLLENKDSRYSEPMLVGVTVVATYWLDRLRPRLRRVAVGAVVAYGAVLFYASSFGVGLLPQDAYVHLGKGCRFYPYFTGPCPGSSIPALQSLEPSGEIVNRRGIRNLVAERVHQRAAERGTVVPGGNVRGSRPVEPVTDALLPGSSSRLHLVQRLHHGLLRAQAQRLPGCPLAQADFAGVRTVAGEQPPELPGFREVRRYELPAGGALTLYARKVQVEREAPSSVPPDELARAEASLGHDIYWAGPKANHAYELTIGANGNTFVRYLPPGVAAGDPRAYLTVASYPLRDAFAVTLAGREQVRMPSASPSKVRSRSSRRVFDRRACFSPIPDPTCRSRSLIRDRARLARSSPRARSVRCDQAGARQPRPGEITSMDDQPQEEAASPDPPETPKQVPGRTGVRIGAVIAVAVLAAVVVWALVDRSDDPSAVETTTDTTVAGEPTGPIKLAVSGIRTLSKASGAADLLDRPATREHARIHSNG